MTDYKEEDFVDLLIKEYPLSNYLEIMSPKDILFFINDFKNNTDSIFITIDIENKDFMNECYIDCSDNLDNLLVEMYIEFPIDKYPELYI